MYRPQLFSSFFLGGFECSTQRRADGRRLDLLDSTGHARWAAADYALLHQRGLHTVRDGLRWHLIETSPGRYDWSSFLPLLEAARRQRTQVIWDLCHYGWPDDLDIWRPAFVERFAAFAAATARVVREQSDEVPFYAPINEISFWAWAGGDEARFNPMARGRGFELKHQLIRASIAAIEAVRAVDPRARFVQIDPAIHVHPRSPHPGEQRAAEHFRQTQFEAWDMLCGEVWPGLGGRPEYLDILGLNYYPHNQWYLGGETITPGSADYRPLLGILGELHQRYRRPMLIAETGAEGDLRADWLRYVGEQVGLALQRNLPLEGICLYPVLDYPGWDNDRPCPTGLFGFADEQGQRPLHAALADELRLQQARFTAVGRHSAPADAL
ncbi:glycoside hydrolase family 1 protein [Pseudomonas mangrovi]|uniref:Beta-glucosidase n=1 Tax=Pseudomonas mangrovi TaxID=2161748 RepID=A0A2T5P5W1_9PSED|nr:family 1 glycosylhydrolase [Pseudomonas mangrovi]PTU73131.1 beta-glucosidase [Pseudomonas mangrovi]